MGSIGNKTLSLQILFTERRGVGICWAKLKPKGPKGTVFGVWCLVFGVWCVVSGGWWLVAGASWFGFRVSG
jgi:hypothetical protein